MTVTDSFHQYRALSFDCYGTLIDWEAGIAKAFQPWAEANHIRASLEELVEALGAHESTIQTESPNMLYPLVLQETLRRIAQQFDALASDRECIAFGASVGDWPAFPDSVEALRRLKERFRLVILSNVDRISFAASNARLKVEFDLIVTAQDVGAYKPSARSFPALFEGLSTVSIDRHHLLHVAQSLFHDHEPAALVDLPSVWIDRRGGRHGFGATPAPQSGFAEPALRYPSMMAFADAVLASTT
jgi:2-haloacid dehalogenase